MGIGARHVTGTLLVLAGVATCLFFGFLLGMADCGPDCIERGERAPVYGLLGVGVFLVALGIGLAARVRGLKLVGSAMLAGGLVATGGALWSMAEGARGAMAWVTLAIGAGVALIGAFLRFWRPR